MADAVSLPGWGKRGAVPERGFAVAMDVLSQEEGVPAYPAIELSLLERHDVDYLAGNGRRFLNPVSFCHDAYPPSSVGEHLRLWRQRRLAPGHS